MVYILVIANCVDHERERLMTIENFNASRHHYKVPCECGIAPFVKQSDEILSQFVIFFFPCAL